MALHTTVPEALTFRGIEPPLHARGFTITLDEADPRAGGRIAGRVERRNRRRDDRPIHVDVRCQACWVDVAPQLVGRKRMLGWATFGEVRTRHVPIWLDEEVFRGDIELGPLQEDNWHRFAFDLPDGVPPALEGTFVAFRWSVHARRKRAIGSERASLPLLVVEDRDMPVVRIEQSPIGTWRLLEWRADSECGASAGPCSLSFAQRRAEDLPRREPDA